MATTRRVTKFGISTKYKVLPNRGKTKRRINIGELGTKRAFKRPGSPKVNSTSRGGRTAK